MSKVRKGAVCRRAKGEVVGWGRCWGVGLGMGGGSSGTVGRSGPGAFARPGPALAGPPVGLVDVTVAGLELVNVTIRCLRGPVVTFDMLSMSNVTLPPRQK